MPPSLFPFQADLTAWAIHKGRGALFEDCGLGKTLQELVWAENIHRFTGKPVLLLTPLAVSAQTIREGEKFGIPCIRSHDGTAQGGITVTNYEQLHKFSVADYGGVVCDESSILKSFDGSRRQEITDFMRKVPYRLLATATAAPNDYVELGTSSEALGYLGHMDMLSRFFKNDQNNCATKRLFGEAPKWRFKGHAEIPFWRWATSWARAIRKPSDIGHGDNGFILPPIHYREHLIIPNEPTAGYLFTLPAIGMREQRMESKRTVRERCEKAAGLVNGTGQPALVWCHRNDEGDMLEELIPGCVQVAGSDNDAVKEARLLAFANGEARVLVTKPRIGAWGLNFQHCAHVVYFPSHSYESLYQAVRRCWRFGQKREVTVDIILTEGEKRIMDNLKRKAESADRMFANLVAEMENALNIKHATAFKDREELPAWL